MNIGLIIAGGSGQRMGQNVPKQFLNVNDVPIIIYTLQAFQKSEEVDTIAVVCKEGWENVLSAYAKQFNIDKLKHIFKAGSNGQESIKNGIFGLNDYYSKEDIVLVHDAIRPMVSQKIISDCLKVTKKFGNGIASIPTMEAVLQTKDGIQSSVSVPRSELKRTQTPQGFSLGTIIDMHKEAHKRRITNSVASCTLAVELGKPVFMSVGSEKNLKITTVDDLDIFKALLATKRLDWIK